MGNIKLTTSFVNGWQASRLAASLKWPKSRTLGLYVQLLANAQEAMVESGTFEAITTLIPAPSKTAAAFLDALVRAQLVMESIEAGQKKYLIVLLQGMVARHERQKEVARAAGKISAASKKTARNASRRGRKPKESSELVPAPPAQKAVTTLDGPMTTFQRHCSVTWQAYHDAYLQTTRQPPVRNAKANSLIQNIVKQLGSEAPEVLQYYCSHPNRLYIAAVYPLDLAARDAQALRTQWLNQRYVTPDNVKQRMDDNSYQDRLRALDEMAR